MRMLTLQVLGSNSRSALEKAGRDEKGVDAIEATRGGGRCCVGGGRRLKKHGGDSRFGEEGLELTCRDSMSCVVVGCSAAD